jgi:putative copper resistance protein D
MSASVRPPAVVAGALLLASLLGAALAGPVLGHGSAPPEPTAATLLTGWSFDPLVWLPVLLGVWAWSAAVRSIDRTHPTNPVPRRRTAAWLGGLAVLVVALQSPIDAYDTTLFTAHMLQHLLLTMVAAPLLVLSAPVTLLLRRASPGIRRRWVLPVLHSRALRVVTRPVVAWVVFAAVMWVSHFSALFDAALEDPAVHFVEHALYLGAAVLFWFPVIAVDPVPHRLSHPIRIGYLALGMPWSSFLGLAIFSAATVLYPHYASLERTWGMTPLEDQAWAGGLMWAGGDLVFLVAVVLAVRTWLRAEEAEGRRVDALLDRDPPSRVSLAARPPASLPRSAHRGRGR